MNKIKDKKKYIKSQAVEDVLEILIKNGELPPSAANDPTTPTTPEKLNSLKNQTNPFTNSKGLQTSCESKQIENNNNINNSFIKMGAQNNATLDFDFILDLEGLAEAMDLNVAINEKALKSEKFNNDNNNNNSYQNQCNSGITKNNNNSELSLNEFMEFQDCNLNVEDNHWMEMASTSAPSNEQNLLNYNESEDPNNIDMNFDNNNNNSNSNSGQICIAGSSLTKSENSKHDPILPNTMFGGHENLVDPLGVDLFFDDNELKSSLDLGSLVWLDKPDFAT